MLGLVVAVPGVEGTAVTRVGEIGLLKLCEVLKRREGL